MRIVGLLGAAGSGKSTVSNYLVEKHGAVKYAFADPLKEIARRVFDFTHDQLYGSQAVKEAIDSRFNFSPRWLLQKLGTEGIREVLGHDIWWQTCLRKIMADKPELAVIEDFRFENEVEGFLAINDALTGSDEQCPVMIWRVESPVSNSSADPDHQSEAEWSKCRYTHLIKPEKYGILQLYQAIGDVVEQCEIPKAAPRLLPDFLQVSADLSEPLSDGQVESAESTEPPLCLASTDDGPCGKLWNHGGDHEAG